MPLTDSDNRCECVVLEASTGKRGKKRHFHLNSLTTHKSVAWKIARSFNNTDKYYPGKATNEFEIVTYDDYVRGRHTRFMEPPADFDYEMMTAEWLEKQTEVETSQKRCEEWKQTIVASRAKLMEDEMAKKKRGKPAKVEPVVSQKKTTRTIKGTITGRLETAKLPQPGEHSRSFERKNKTAALAERKKPAPPVVSPPVAPPVTLPPPAPAPAPEPSRVQYPKKIVIDGVEL